MDNIGYLHRLIGHEQIKKQWCTLYEASHIPHAMIFAGSQGLGKTTAAFSLASLLCQRQVMTSLEDTSTTLLEQDRDEVYYIRPMGKLLKVEQFRALQEELQMTGREGACRVCIIDEVQTMNKEFANRMLKTLEEPPEGVYFILITSQPERLLPTILSRCTMVRFLPVPEQELIKELQRVKGWIPEAMEEAVLLGGGNVERTIALYETGQVEGVTQSLAFFRIFGTSKTPYVLWQEVLIKEEIAMLGVLRWMLQISRDMMAIRAGAMELVGLKKYQEELLALLPAWTNGDLQQVMKAVEMGIEALERHVNQKLIWDYICIQVKRDKGGIWC